MLQKILHNPLLESNLSVAFQSKWHRPRRPLIGEINVGIGYGDGEEREWICDSGADYHMSGDINVFDSIEDIPSTFHVKQIKGKVAITRWGVVRLSTDKGNGVKV